MKTVEDLKDSRAGYESILNEYGRLPQSIMVHNKSDKALDFMAEDRNYAALSNRGGHTGKLGDAFEASGRSCRASNHGERAALSRFPQNVGRSLLLLYTKRGDTVVDPFAGHNSRMELCWRSGRNYVGCDLSQRFMEANRAIAKILENDKTLDFFAQTDFTASITLHECDSRQMPIADETGDFTITSPPYWDIEYYGDEPEQLGTGKSYEAFLDGLYQVMRENFRCLKHGAFCIWCINDFRKDGKFYSYHEHTAEGLRQAGFTQWDIAITDLGSSMRQCFPNQVIEQKILPKRHEYCLIFRKLATTRPAALVRSVATNVEQSAPAAAPAVATSTFCGAQKSFDF